MLDSSFECAPGIVFEEAVGCVLEFNAPGTLFAGYISHGDGAPAQSVTINDGEIYFEDYFYQYSGNYSATVTIPSIPLSFYSNYVFFAPGILSCGSYF